ncbi:transcription-repair coupling factor [Algiphilus sp.]|uniref:transcription-repair coupling factor n=1 Tax=Algiphilus sp. TaxID=1872431 RepID=UPI003C5F6996
MPDDALDLRLPLPVEPGTPVDWPALPDPAPAMALAAAARENRPLIVVCANESEAYRLESELRFFADADVPITHLPDTEVLPYDAFSPHQELVSDRMAALSALPAMRRGVVVTTIETLLLRLPPRDWLSARRFAIAEGDTLDPQAFRERLIAAGYQSVSEVQTQGEFALRGALVDLFPMGGNLAYRIDLFDDEVESIRCFDPETQRSTERVAEIDLLPAREFPTDREAIERFRRQYRAYFPGDPSRSKVYESVSRGIMPAGIESYFPLFFEHTAGIEDHLPADAVLCLPAGMTRVLDEQWQQIGERFERYSGNIERPLMAPADLYRAPDAVDAVLSGHARLAIGAAEPGADAPVALGEDGADAFAAAIGEAPRTLLVAESPGRVQAVQDWLRPRGMDARQCTDWQDFRSGRGRVCIAQGPLQHSVRLADGTLLVSETQLFGLRAQVARPRTRVRDPETLLRDLSALNPGSPVVHVEHGVGRYQGLTTLDAGGVSAEYLVIEYAKGDRIYVPVAQLNLVHRYTGAEDEAAPLHNLGSERWKKATSRARKRAFDVAAELLQVQARREATVGTVMQADADDYAAFCEAFPFETTPDQQSAIDAVLADMAASRPMDRVVCGDVGFGKTEVALRAAYAAVTSNRQVCVLVPTTLLAQQHYKNFCDRFAGMPVRIAAASRLKSDKDLQDMLAETREGKVDILIGTHRLLQPDVRFKQLGLVIVDEEHRFGVRHKEKLKAMRAQVDLLTLTATPIPRTLNMSLAGLRDLSIIATPPEGRMAIKTFVADWEQALVQEAFMRELKRGGQIYYLHNQVKDIERVAADLRQLVPEARIRVAHGQMRTRELEQVMLDFYHHRFDVLCCTTIVESGIDVPNANTIVMNRADTFGLAQLHQLRGRVGRSHHRAYAYLLVPSRTHLPSDAEKRLEAIENLGDLGSGFQLATHDLEIRGAGELLGDEQSGQIEEVGFTLYAELLERAVRAVRSGAISDEALSDESCTVDLGASALIPEDYVPDVHTRLALYQRLTAAATPDDADALKSETIDRFGALPEAVETLFAAARLRLRARTLGITQLRTGDHGVSITFAADTPLDPVRLIGLVQSDPRAWRMEGEQKLVHRVEADDLQARIDNTTAAIDRLATTRSEAGNGDDAANLAS